MEDLDRIMEVMARAFDPAYGEAWTRRQVEDAILIGNCHYGLVDASGQPPMPDKSAVGFYMSRTGFEEEELLLIAVVPEYRKKGLAGDMLLNLYEGAKSRGAKRLLLEMRRGNPAESLYRSFGFTPIGERVNYYRMPNGRHIDAITFSRTIE